MATIKDVIRYKVAGASTAIRMIKDKYATSAAARAKAEDAARWMGGDEFSAAQRRIKEEYPHWKTCINPKCQEWGDYVALKDEASLWLTAININRRVGDPLKATKADLKALRAEGLLRHHAAKKGASRLACRALRELRRIARSLENPSELDRRLLANAAEWAAKDEAERQARRAQKGADKALVGV